MNKKNLKKLALISILGLFPFSLSAENTICYKNNTDILENIETIPFEGQECKGKFSINDMKLKGWKIIDIKVSTQNNLYSYKYLLSDSKNSQKSYKTPLNTKIDSLILNNVQNNQSVINIGNLKIGQTGIVIHKYDNQQNIILANAKVIESSKNNSVIKFFDFDGLKQDAIPTINKKVTKGDILKLNYLYNSALLITPSQEVFQSVRKKFKNFNFTHSDIFAAQLKFDNNPKPTILDIQEYAKSKELGTIFIVVDKKINILDTKTLNILDSYFINYDETNYQLPFYTRVEDIKTIIPDADKIKNIVEIILAKLKDEEIKENYDDYENYYKNQIGL